VGNDAKSADGAFTIQSEATAPSRWKGLGDKRDRVLFGFGSELRCDAWFVSDTCAGRGCVVAAT